MKYRTLTEVQDALESGETSCEQLVSFYLDTIRERDDRIHAYLSVSGERALDRARLIDRRRARGEDPGRLTGLVIGVKDVICIEGRPVTCGSHMLENFTSLYDATVIERLTEAGAIVIGKLNCDEFAMGSSNENSYFGPVRNPANTDYVPGGSSGGSAAAVAAGMCHASLGTDTGGSVRQPAAFCGVVGLKPTYGRVSRSGLVAFASSFDVIGPLANTVEDVAEILSVIAGKDPSDSSSAPVEVPDYTAALTGSVDDLVVGLPDEYYSEGLDPEMAKIIEAQVEKLRAGGAEIREVSLPHTEYGIATYYVLTTAEASSNLARYDGVRYGYRADLKELKRKVSREKATLKDQLSEAADAADDQRVEMLEEELANRDSLLDRLYQETRTEGFGAEVKRRIMLGTYVLSAGYYEAYYGKAQRVRTLIRRDFERVFEDVDLLLTPATPAPAFELGSKVDDPLDMYLSDVYTVNANLAGIPGLVVPAGTYPDGSNRPVGLQLLGDHFDEATLLRAGHFLEMQ
jgi:aspartyl-tRNA(Asn)/glutamyl-tRNA(Gln) amidotransferase subunit A